MNLTGKTLDAWLKEFQGNQLPLMEVVQTQPLNLWDRYINISTFLSRNIANFVGLGAFAKDNNVFLTDHGPEHIKRVILRASDLVNCQTCTLSAYEVYILLVAIQIHDAGNILGRKGHETSAQLILNEIKPFFQDSGERRFIYKIASAHGGTPPDKLEKLPKTEHILGYLIRPQLLAAILKFADELADDSTRTTQSIEALDVITPQSKLHHRYCSSLHSVNILHDDKSVQLKFTLHKDDIFESFDKGSDSKTYLIDEILTRVMKTHSERIYCIRHTRPDIDIERIRVRIEFFDNPPRDYNSIMPDISFTIEEKGYPLMSNSSIHELCPDLKVGGQLLCGANLIQEASKVLSLTL